MRIAIVDDEQEMRDTLAEYIARYASENGAEIETIPFPSGDTLLENYRLIYDIIFDVDMPGTSGIDAARLVRERDRSVVILFVTNIAQYAINGYEVAAVDYIIKPIGYYDFAMKFRRAVAMASRGQRRELFLETAEGGRRLPVSSILYVETLGHYLIYHLDGEDGRPRELRVRGNMKEQEAALRPYEFCQIHKSYLVNLAHMEELRTGHVLVGGQELPVGRTYKDELVTRFFRFARG